MKRLLLVVLVGCGMIALLEAQTLERAVIASGAVRAQNGSVAVQATIGQPIVGLSLSSSLAAGHGFWYRLSQQLSSVERTTPLRVRIEPQPVVTAARIVGECSSALQAALLTLQGKQLETLEFVARGTLQEAQLDCTERASGLYIVRVQCGSAATFLPLLIAK